MQTFFEWFASNAVASSRPWLIVGKGRTYEKIEASNPAAYNLFALNHVVRDRKVFVAHAIDLDVVLDCAAAVDANAAFLAMPWVPHQNFKPGGCTLAQLATEVPILGKLDREGRLLTYDAATAPGTLRRGDAQLVPVTFFSAEAALGLLALSGVKEIHTIGVDGGTSYAANFRDIEGRTKLANSQPTFDKQFSEFAKILYQTKARLTPMGIPTPVRVFVGAEPEQELAVAVLADSIQRHSSLAVAVCSLAEADIVIPMPRAESNRGKTPFSFQRFVIPQLCGFEGRAIYVDSDMQVFKDIRGLWDTGEEDYDLLTVQPRPDTHRPPQNSVLVLNCGALKWEINDIVDCLDRGDLTYAKLMQDMVVNNQPPKRSVPDVWNSLEHYVPDETALIHYTDMADQPWVSHRNPLGHLWFKALFAALDAGAVSERLVEEAIRFGHVRPSLGIQVERRIADGRKLKSSQLAADSKFIAPYQKLTGNSKPGAHLRPGFVDRVRGKLAKLVPGI